MSPNKNKSPPKSKLSRTMTNNQINQLSRQIANQYYRRILYQSANPKTASVMNLVIPHLVESSKNKIGRVAKRHSALGSLGPERKLIPIQRGCRQMNNKVCKKRNKPNNNKGSNRLMKSKKPFRSLVLEF